MDIDGLSSFRPGDPNGEDGEFFAEDAREVGAGTAACGLVGAAVGCVIAASLPAMVVGACVAGVLYSGGCGVKALWNKLT